MSEIQNIKNRIANVRHPLNKKRSDLMDQYIASLPRKYLKELSTGLVDLDKNNLDSPEAGLTMVIGYSAYHNFTLDRFKAEARRRFGIKFSEDEHYHNLDKSV